MKILALGRTTASSQLTTRIKAINAKYGPFDACLLTIEDWDPLLKEEDVDLPVPSYFIAANREFPESIDQHLAANDNQYGRNMFYLGKTGIYATADGLRIAFIGGSDSTSPQADGIEEEQRVFYPSDIEAMLGRTEKPGVPTAVDILLTFEWSAGIAANDERFSSGGSKSIASLAIKFQPRYHFTSKAHVFFERAPYRNLESAHPTRFISLAPVGNQVKERWFYAMNITPISVELPVNNALPSTTENPLIASAPSTDRQQKRESNGFFFAPSDTKRARTAATSRQPPDGYVCKICSQSGHYIQDCPNKPPPSIPEGYICNICREPGHLIRDCPKKVTTASSGNQPPDGYVCRICQKTGHFIRECPEKPDRPAPAATRPPQDSGPCWFCLSNPKLEKHLIVSIADELYLSLPKGELVPDHLLLLSIEHIPNSLQLHSETAKIEMEKFKESLRGYFAKKDLEMVWFETNLRSQHMNIQIIPIPKDKSLKLRPFIEQEAAKLEAVFEDVAQLELNPREHFYRFELPDGQKIAYRPQGRFGVQFGRHLLADFLDIKERADWKQCVKSEADESRDAERFKFMFKQFDFTMNEES